MKFFKLTISLSIIFCGLFGLAQSSQAATINAASCSRSDVQSAINSASDGDTVIVPVGICTWMSVVTISGKGITLNGAGVGLTNITNQSSSSQVLDVTTDSSHATRITGFTFKGSTSSSTRHIRIDGAQSNMKFRIDNCKFQDGYLSGAWQVGVAIFVDGPYGVIDHCTFDEGGKEVIHVFATSGPTSWATNSSLGTADAVYIEDNIFTNSQAAGAVHAILGQSGGRYVFRYNTVDDMNIDAHGYCGSAQGGTRHIEVYENNFTVDAGNNMARWFFIRGGSGVVYNNTMTRVGTLSNHIHLTDYRVDVPISNPCGGADNTCCCTYPCKDQVGRGKDQGSEPLYIWNNKVNGVTATVATSDFGTGDCETICGKTQNMSVYIQENRDFYNGTRRPGYTAYTYPHPLRNESSGDTTAPASPSGLTVQ